ncbi:MAG: nucleotidyltransferase domain-containing protein [bacterium]
MLNLTQEEQEWLDTYRKVLGERFPGLVEDLIVFGSKARGDATPDSDLDILVIIQEGDHRVKRGVSSPGYHFSIGMDVVPSILVFTVAEWDRFRRLESVFRESVLEEGVSVQ